MSTPAEGGRLGRGLTGRLAVLEEPARFWEPCCDPCWDGPSMGEGSSGVMGAEGALCRLPPLCRPSGDSLLSAQAEGLQSGLVGAITHQPEWYGPDTMQSGPGDAAGHAVPTSSLRQALSLGLSKALAAPTSSQDASWEGRLVWECSGKCSPPCAGTLPSWASAGACAAAHMHPPRPAAAGG